MATTKKPAPAKASPKTDIVNWEKEMAEFGASAAQTEKLRSLTNKIQTAGGILKIDDQAIEDNEMRVIVVGAVFENQYYDKPYDSSNPTVPACYAFGDVTSTEPEDGMAPHESAEDPQGSDNGLCAGCWANEFGSADVGRGKACKNIRRLGVITEDALESASALKDAEVRLLNVPVMSVKNWSKFVHGINEDYKRPFWGAICLLKVRPDPRSQFVVTFSLEELIEFDSDLYTAMKAKVASVNEQLTLPYPKQADLDAARPQKVHGPASRKKPNAVAAKPAARAKPGAKPVPAAAGKSRKF